MSTETVVRTRAYEIWEAEGRPHGRDAEHWFRALAEIAGSPEMTTPEAAAPLKRAAKKASNGTTTARKRAK
jgi:hypothetical protein